MASTGISRARLVLLCLFALAFVVALLFVPAGRLDWKAGWAYLALLTASVGCHIVYVSRRNPGLFAHRLRAGRGTKGWDRTAVVLLKLVFMAVLVLGALDAGRFGWTSVPAWLWWPGAALHSFGMTIVTWSMAVNPHFEATVRIQEDREHRVIDRGPYRVVRHPGYAGF
ncbi:MAG: isoprenylcysteine carboxylmethyltransferase family protein, partial [Planctomycetota bacterium]